MALAGEDPEDLQTLLMRRSHLHFAVKRLISIPDASGGTGQKGLWQ